jgi:hypothetical protein
LVGGFLFSKVKAGDRNKNKNKIPFLKLNFYFLISGTLHIKPKLGRNTNFEL